jgi:hypothetical protein
LTQYRIPEIAIYALYPPGRHLSVKVRSFVDFLVPRFGERPSWDAWMPATERKKKPPGARPRAAGLRRNRSASRT